MSGKGLIPEAWLFDAPLFIDADRITSLYNAVALPAYEQEEFTIALSDLKVSKWEAGAQLEVSAAESVIAKLLAPISVKGTAHLSGGREQQEGSDQAVKLKPVTTPERKLLQLAIHYGTSLQDRVWTVNGMADGEWLDDPSFASELPKALVFIDVSPDTPFVPMAAELSDGKVVLFYQKIADEARESGAASAPPDYPRSDDPDELNHYWSWFQQNFESSVYAMRVVEKVVGAAGRPQWVDYRVPVGAHGSQGRSLHLNIKSRGKYDTGDFAYLLLRRGRRHGVRLVGTLKSGPALNVLAIYEK